MNDPTPPAERWRARLRASLLQARKAKDTQRVNALRSALSVIDNAEILDDQSHA